MRRKYGLILDLCVLCLIVLHCSVGHSVTEKNIGAEKSMGTANIKAPHEINAKEPFKLEEATIESVHAAIQNKELTCKKLVTGYLDRIHQYNLSVSEKPPINSLTEINPLIKADAEKLDDYYATKQRFRGPLHCVPIILKDNIDSYDTTTTAGSFSMLGNQPIRDSFLLSKLREAGAIILATGGMDEFGWSIFGISSRIGRIGNAYDTSKNPGGSSGGVAAAISANFGLVGFGTDNAGSIRIPAAFNGLNGLRPSTGLISQRGVFPMGNLDAVAGPITRNVKDLAVVLQVIAKNADPLDLKTIHVPRLNNYLGFLNEDSLQGKRIGIIRRVANHDTFEQVPKEVMDVFNNAFKIMRQSGATIVDQIILKDYDLNRKYNQAGEAQDVDDYFKSFPGTRKSFQDICESDRTRTFGTVQECLKFIKENPTRESDEYKEVLAIFQKNKNYVETLMQENKLDALIMPVSQTGSATYNPYAVNTWFSPVASNAGLPSLVINAGYNPKDTLPVGIELIGKQYEEGPLLAMAYAYEKKAPPRIPPTLVESTLKLKKYDIAEMNNFFTLLGQDSYQKVLKDSPARDLTPERFNSIFTKRIQDWAAKVERVRPQEATN